MFTDLRVTVRHAAVSWPVRSLPPAGSPGPVVRRARAVRRGPTRHVHGQLSRSRLRQRVERAKEMLREADMRVLDVAVACGFKTQQHFARVFRRMCGGSPTEYRYEVLR